MIGIFSKTVPDKSVMLTNEQVKGNTSKIFVQYRLILMGFKKMVQH